MILHIQVDMPDFSFAKVREMQEQIENIFRGYAIKLSVEDPYGDDDESEDEKYYFVGDDDYEDEDL